MQAGIGGEMRRADQLAVVLVSPAVNRADDMFGVAAPFEQGGLAMAADIGQKFYAIFVAYQHPGVVHPFQHMVVAGIRRHQFVSDVLRAGIEQHALFDLQHLRVEIPAQRRLG